MAYSFVGFFAKPLVGRPSVLPEGAVWCDIDAPFVGVGIRLGGLIDETPTADEVEALAAQLGISLATDWIFLNYVCWGGQIDFVYGLGVSGGQRFGPIDESARSGVEAAYLGLMGAFGVSPEDALRFPPFRRGFWGEN